MAVLLILLLGWFADRLVQYIPFEAETQLAASFADIAGSEQEPVQPYLQQLAERAGKATGLPGNIHLHIHFVREPTVNAMATLGGHIIVYEGLLRHLSSEDAIVMLLAHEVAHIHHRHPIRAMGRGFTLAMAISLINTGTGISLAGDMVGQAGLMTVLHFSRQQEQEADREALQALAVNYGHIAGAVELFDVLAREDDPLLHHEWLSSHPLTGNRIQQLRQYAETAGWPVQGMLTSIPLPVQQALQ